MIISIFVAIIATGPRSVPFLAEYVSKEISAVLPENTNVHLDGVHLGFSRGNLTFFLRGVSIGDVTKGICTFQQISIGLNIAGLTPFSHHNLFNVQLSAPELKFFATEMKEGGDLFGSLKHYLDQNMEKILKYSIELSNSSFVIPLSGDKHTEVDIKRLTIKPEIMNKNLVFLASGELGLKGYYTPVHAILSAKTDRFDVEGSIADIRYEMLAENGYGLPILDGASIKADLNFKTFVNKDSALNDLDFIFTNVAGEIKSNKYFIKNLPISNVEASGACKDLCSDITLNKLNLKLGELDLSSNFSLKSSSKSKVIKGNFRFNNLPIDSLEHYWPTNVIPESRSWVIKHINEGTISSADIAFDLDLNTLVSKNRLEKGAIVGTIELDKTSVAYMDTVSRVRDVSGKIAINNDNLSFHIIKGIVKDTELVFAEGEIVALAEDNTKMHLVAETKGSVQDLVDLGFAHAGILQHSFKNLKGSSVTNLTLDIPIRDGEIGIDEVGLLAESKILDFAGERLYGKHFLSKGNLQATYKDAVIKVEGYSRLDDVLPVNLLFTNNLKSNEQNTFIKAKLNWKDFSKFGFRKPVFVNNLVGVEYHLQEQKGVVRKEVNLDLANSAIDIPGLGITKKVGEPGVIKFSIDDSQRSKNIADFYINVASLESRGYGSASADLSEIYSLYSEKTKLGKSEFTFQMDHSMNITDIKIEGDSLDLSSIKLLGGPEKDGSMWDNLRLFAKVDKIFLHNNVILHMPELELKCTVRECEKLILTGQTAEGQGIAIDLAHPKIEVKADDAGVFTKAFGISEKIGSGAMTISGLYDGDTIEGTLNMADFRLNSAPLLARIMSLTSLTLGVFDSLGNIIGGGGIAFDKASCPFIYENGVIKINQCQAMGPSLIISGNGYINLKQDIMKISGTIASNNIVNSTLGKIPLFGQAITGNDKNGLIGANFTIEGAIDNAEVSANPLSILTPGIFRQIFGNNSSDSNSQK